MVEIAVVWLIPTGGSAECTKHKNVHYSDFLWWKFFAPSVELSWT
jgi:hypothetical protein